MKKPGLCPNRVLVFKTKHRTVTAQPMKRPSNIQVYEFGVGNVPVIKHKIPVFIGDFNIPCSLYGTTYRLPSNIHYNLSTLLFNSLRKQKVFSYVIKWLVVSVPCWYGVGKEILLRFEVCDTEVFSRVSEVLI